MIYSEKYTIYQEARKRFGDTNQIIVAIEELSELQKELTKYLRGIGSIESIAEEIADSKIMIEQVTEILGCSVNVFRNEIKKIERLDSRIKKVQS